MRLRFVLLLAATSILIAVHPPSAPAATLKVCPSGCTFSSVQDAINAAATGDTINLSPGTYTETLLIAAPVAARSLTLKGSGAKNTIVDGNRKGTVLEVDTNYAVDVTGLTFTNGENLPAGGILNHGRMTLTNVVVTNNIGDQAAGGIGNDIDGTLTMIRTTVSANQSSGIAGRGGGLFNVGVASIRSCTISGNTSPVGGGIENSGIMDIRNSDLIGNTSSSVGGALDNRSISGVTKASVTVTNSSIAGNEASAGGGINNGIGSVTLVGTPLRANNAALEGGGLENSSKGITELRNSPVVGNVSKVNAGGVAASGGTLTLIDSAVKNNLATSTTGVMAGGVGVFGGTVTLTRSPVIHNSATGSLDGKGGGVVILNGATLSLQNSRVTDNTASTDGGGIYALTGTVTFQGTSPVRRNQPNNCVNVPGC